jgi:hypothetical protein
LAGNLATAHPASQDPRDFQIVSETPRDALELPTVSALVGGMKAYHLECFGPWREGQFVLHCALPKVPQASEAQQLARAPEPKKPRKISATLVSRASQYIKLLEDASPPDDINRLASLLFTDKGTLHYTAGGEVLREPPAQRQRYAQVGLVLETLQTARAHAGCAKGSLTEAQKGTAKEHLERQAVAGKMVYQRAATT